MLMVLIFKSENEREIGIPEVLLLEMQTDRLSGSYYREKKIAVLKHFRCLRALFENASI